MTDPTNDPRFPLAPYPAYAAMRSVCPVQAVPTGPSGHSSYLVTGYAEAREALSDPRLSKDTAAFFADKGSRRPLHPAVAHSTGRGKGAGEAGGDLLGRVPGAIGRDYPGGADGDEGAVVGPAQHRSGTGQATRIKGPEQSQDRCFGRAGGARR